MLREVRNDGSSLCAELLGVTPEWIESVSWDNEELDSDLDLALDLSRALGVKGAIASSVIRSRHIESGRVLIGVSVGKSGRWVLIADAPEAEIRVAVTPPTSKTVNPMKVFRAVERYLLRIADAGVEVH